MKKGIANLEDRDVELYIGKILRFGVLVSCLITLIGGVIYLFQHHGVVPDYSPVPSQKVFLGSAQYLRGLSTILPRVLMFDGAAIIQLGIIVLIATPITRVAFSAIAFLIERDYLYVLITFLVLGVMCMSMIFKLH